MTRTAVRTLARRALVVAALALVTGLVPGLRAQTAPAGQLPLLPVEPAPRITFETSAGRFTVETFPLDAPSTVAHIVKLVKAGFYDGQRVHRAIPGFVVQFGDPQTRDESKRSVWGRGVAASSGEPIGVAEVLLKHKHLPGAVGVAHMGEPAQADSQVYIVLDTRPELDGQYAIFGQIVDGLDVPGHLHVGDTIIRATVSGK